MSLGASSSERSEVRFGCERCWCWWSCAAADAVGCCARFACRRAVDIATTPAIARLLGVTIPAVGGGAAAELLFSNRFGGSALLEGTWKNVRERIINIYRWKILLCLHIKYFIERKLRCVYRFF